MSPEPDIEAPPSPSSRSKGKARAVDDSPMSERTPLLSSTHTRSRSSSLSSRETTSNTRRTSRTWLCCRLFVIFAACTALFIAGLYALGNSYAARAEKADPAMALRVRPPLHIEVLSATKGEVVLRARTYAGVDAASMMGLYPDLEGPERPDPFGVYAWKWLGRAGVRAMGRVTILAGEARVRDSRGTVLARAWMDDVTVPLGVEEGEEWLEEVAVDIRVQPTENGDELIRFAKESWTRGVVRLDVDVDDVRVKGGHGGKGWRGFLKVKKPDVGVEIRKKIPAIPGMPAPGRDAPLPDMSKLVTMTSFDISSTKNSTVVVNATATIINPAPPEIDLTIPELPYLVSLVGPDNETVPMANAYTKPFSLSERPNITLHIGGTVLPLKSTTAFSNFLSDYLTDRAHPIELSTPLYPSIKFPSEFPPAYPRPKVLREMALRDMRVRLLPNGAAVGSGNVYARIVLPKGINIAMDVHRVIPDVLVFDGPVPDGVASTFDEARHPPVAERTPPSDDDDEDPPPPGPPLPNPLPPRAFAHIRPSHWLPATSVPAEREDENDGTAIDISARFVDVPLVVLPGREREFSAFVGKVVFGKSARAGLQGTVACGAYVAGLPSGNGSSSGVVIDGLPFEGSVLIGKPGF